MVRRLILPLTNSMHTQLNEKSHEEKEKSPRRMSGLNLFFLRLDFLEDKRHKRPAEMPQNGSKYFNGFNYNV